jgi:transcriptional regulator with XRE-family HTH domain
MEDIRLVYGPRIREARKFAGLRQIELAGLLETTQETVSGWENSKVDISSERMQRISAVLRVPLGWFYGHPESPEAYERPMELAREAIREAKEKLEAIEAMLATDSIGGG